MRRSAWSRPLTVCFERRKKNLEFAPARTVGVLRLTRSCHLHFELRDFLSGSVVRIIATVIAVEHFHDHQKKASTSWLVSRAFYIGTWLCCYLFDNFSTTERKITMFYIWLICTYFARLISGHSSAPLHSQSLPTHPDPIWRHALAAQPSRETIVSDLFVTLKVHDDVLVDESEPYIGQSEASQDLFDLMQPRVP